jgi:hypothetical protein
MPARLDRLCPLCPPQLPVPDSHWVWWAWIEGGEEAVAAASIENLEDPVDAECARRHCVEHRPLQAPARKTLGRAEALAQIERLSPRVQAILELCFRVRALGSEELAALFYMSGNEAAARRGCARDLRKLVNRDLLYRAHLEHLPGEGPRPRTDTPPLFFLGRQARPFIEERYGRWPRKREEWVNEVTDLEQWRAPYELWLRTLPAFLLFSQMQVTDEVGVREAEIDGWRLRFDAANWFDERFARLRFEDPMRQHRRLRGDGLAALGLTGVDGRSALIPFLYYRDLEIRPPERYLERLHAHAAIPRIEDLHQRFPQIPAGTPLPALVICESPARVHALAEASRRLLLPPQTPVLAADRTTVTGHGLSASCWQLLFRPDPPAPTTLIGALTSGATGRAGMAPTLQLHSTL